MRNTTSHWILIFASLLSITSISAAGEWPQFRHDAARSGYSSEPLSPDLTLRWVREPAHQPQPAWKGEDTRMPFDYAHLTVAGRGKVFFGSSVDCQVYALDAATGRKVWSFFTNGPVRFAPALWRDRLFVAGDDGFLYCSAADTGDLLWKKAGGPLDDMLIGNGRMISRWPVRGAPVVLDDRVYFGAGIWPSEGIFIYALDAATGEVCWLNETAGYREMDQPHGGASARSGISVQGYLAAAGDALLLPTGRATPAAFNRDDGTFRYFHLQAYGHRPAGPLITLIDGLTLNVHDIFRSSDGRIVAQGVHGAAVAAFPREIVIVRGDAVMAVAREGFVVETEVVDRKGKKVTKTVLGDPVWTVESPEPLGSQLIGAGNTVVAGTKNHKIITVDVTARRIVTTSAELDGEALGLSAADGRLFVSTEQGTIYCFGVRDQSATGDAGEEAAASGKLKVTKGAPAVATAPASARRNTAPEPAPGDAAVAAAVTAACQPDPLVARAAQEILERSGIPKGRVGFCLDIGCREGQLAAELARRSNLRIVAVGSDPEQIAQVRARLDAAKLYGSRIILQDQSMRLPEYFADLIVSEQSIREGADPAVIEKTLPMQRPWGGVLCLGKPGEMLFFERGPLEGAGQWTHQYCDPANTNCSTDELVKGPLGMLWFADNDFEMPSRHGRSPAPLFWDGLLFVEGLHGLRCLNAYNGCVLWEYPVRDVLVAYDQEHLNGTAITGSNICLAEGVLYLRYGDRCVRLDARTGAELGVFEAPLQSDGVHGTWGFLACESGTLYGSLFDVDHIVRWAYGRSDMSDLFSESRLLFAMDSATGAIEWKFSPVDSIRNNAIAIGGGTVYLIDRPLAEKDTLNGEKVDHPAGRLIALDGKTGEILWERKEDIFGTCLAVSVKHDVLLMSYQHTRFCLPSEPGGRMAAFRAFDGSRLWEIDADYHSRHILNGSTIYAQPAAWDLVTGEQRDFEFTRSYGCGTLSGARFLLTFRSATLGYRDLTVSRGTENYGGVRPGCWINAVPAGGLLLLPEASNRCVCSYLIKATLALKPYGIRPPKIIPGGGTFNRPVTVRLSCDEPTEGDTHLQREGSRQNDAPAAGQRESQRVGDTDLPAGTRREGGDDPDIQSGNLSSNVVAHPLEIHYTLDGSDPGPLSPRYEQPLVLSETATLKTRSFKAGAPPSQVETASFVIDPFALLLGASCWRVVDTPGGTPASSAWKVVKGVASETSNHYMGDASDSRPETDRPGTLRIYTGDGSALYADGTLSLELSSTDDDGLGVAFRVQGPDRYYLWAMDRQRGFRVLAVKDGADYRVLARKPVGYDPHRWYKVRIVLEGSKIAVYLDGRIDLQAEDSTHPRGTFALYSWGCTVSRFRCVRWE